MEQEIGVTGAASEATGLGDTAGTPRNHSVVHVMPRDNVAAAQRLAPNIERAQTGDDTTPVGEGVRVLVVVPSPDDAVAISQALSEQSGWSDRNLVPAPVTSTARARRMLASPVRALVATAEDLLSLVRESALKVDTVRLVAFVWLDELVREAALSPLESLLAEVPREADRLATTATTDETAERFIERFMWRARRLTHDSSEAGTEIEMRYIPTVASNRGEMLRVMLDGFNPATTNVVAFTEQAAHDADRALAALGYTGNPAVRVVRGDLTTAEHSDLAVVYDEPPDARALAAASALGRTAVALVAPSHVARFRALAGAGATPLSFTSAFQNARTSEDRLRDELRGVVSSGAMLPQVTFLEPLCASLDAVDLAAAAVYLLQRERMRTRRAPEDALGSAGRKEAAALPAPSASRVTRVFLNIGERDGVRPGDLVGAITGEAGITGEQIGKIDLRDAYATVEVNADVAPRVMEKLTGSMIRGRRVIAREDRERGATSGRGEGTPRERPPRSPEGRGDRPGSRGPRDSRGGRGGERGDRSDRGPRGAGGGRDFGGARRTPREDSSGDRLPKATREAEEWTERGERLRHARGRGMDGEPGAESHE